MADLKIKAGAGSTNKLLIQSQDQSNNDYAIQIGDAGATTLTNATITAGTIGSGVTFPSGHILQCKGDRYDHKVDGGGVNVTNSTTTPFGTGLEVAITCASTSNFLKLDAYLPDIYTGSNAGGVHGGFVYDTSSFASSYTGLPGTAGTDAKGQYTIAPFNLYGSNGADIFPLPLMVYCPVPTTSAIKIRVYLRTNSAETYEIGGNYAGMSGQSSLTVMEIQA